MKKAILLCSALLLVTASVASAQGLNLAWNDCAGPINKAFACASNAGTNIMTGSYFAPDGVNQLSGNEVVIDLQSAGAVLPAWWLVRGTGQCRNGALTANVGQVTTCENDFWAGNGAGGIGAYNVGFSGAPNRARLVMAFAVPADFIGPVPSGVETYAFTVQVNNTKSTGTGACAGCNEAVCIVLNSINLTQPVGVGDFKVTNSAQHNYVTWQGGVVSGGCPAATPTKNATWGSVKSLYR